MRSPTSIIALVVIALVAAACAAASETAIEHEAHDDAAHEHPELAEPEGGGQAYEIVEGRAGFRRLPAIDVSDIQLLDYATNTAGEEFVPVAATGEILLLFFGYLNCPDVCPTTLADYRATFEALPADITERTTFGMVSVDAERDEGPRVADYVGRFIDRRHGLLAPDAAALATATEAFGVLFEIEDHEPDSVEYAVGHTAIVFAIDDAGDIVWEFTYQTPPQEVAAALVDIFDERY